LEKAHLVISRAGASTVSELAVIGRPSVLVPFAAAMDDHQTANAGALEGAGACVRVSEAEATPGRLREEIVRLLQAPERLGEMATTAGAVGRADAAAALADLVASIAGDARAPQQTGAAA
ncbi:MAG: glycosyltransferase, partial [Pseudomonadota bacterium]